ncbi:MAG: hypothetical protein ACI9PP_001149, partial [Halobacteriales archaeon]
ARVAAGDRDRDWRSMWGWLSGHTRCYQTVILIHDDDERPGQRFSADAAVRYRRPHRRPVGPARNSVFSPRERSLLKRIVRSVLIVVHRGRVPEPTPRYWLGRVCSAPLPRVPRPRLRWPAPVRPRKVRFSWVSSQIQLRSSSFSIAGWFGSRRMISCHF